MVQNQLPCRRKISATPLSQESRHTQAEQMRIPCNHIMSASGVILVTIIFRAESGQLRVNGSDGESIQFSSPKKPCIGGIPLRRCCVERFRCMVLMARGYPGTESTVGRSAV